MSTVRHVILEKGSPCGTVIYDFHVMLNLYVYVIELIPVTPDAGGNTPER